jgi:hypothetical protein
MAGWGTDPDHQATLVNFLMEDKTRTLANLPGLRAGGWICQHCIVN